MIGTSLKFNYFSSSKMNFQELNKILIKKISIL